MDKNILKKLWYYSNKSLKNNEFPVAAIIYDDEKIISIGYNKRNKSNVTTDHAEIIAIQKANKKLNTWRLTNACMVVTLEPCCMCESVIREARLRHVFYIIPRYKNKKQYKRTIFEQLEIECYEKEKYIKDLASFFNDKC